MCKHLIPRMGLLAIAILGPVMSARAAIFISDTYAAGTAAVPVLQYRLNETAQAGSITIASVEAPGVALRTERLSGQQLQKGSHAITLSTSGLAPGTYVFRVQVNAAPHNGYALIHPVTTIAPGATVAYGLRVNKAPDSPVFGHIFMADFQATNDLVAHPVHEFTADGTLVQQIPPSRNTRWTTVALAIGEDGALYVADQDSNSIRRYTASGRPDRPVWTQDAVLTGIVQTPHTDPPTGSLLTRGFQVLGSGEAAEAWITNYSYPNCLEVATLTDATSPTRRIFEAGGLAGRLDQVLVSPDRNRAYVSSGIFAGTGPHLNRYVRQSNGKWALDSAFAENDPTTAKLQGNARGLAFAAEPDLLWVTQNGGSGSEGHIAKVSLTANAGNIVRTREAMSILMGAALPTLPQVRALDSNADGRITIEDAVAILQSASSPGAVIERVPAPSGAPLPITLDTDPKGNLVVGASSNPASDGNTADVFFILAPPDYGSQDTRTSPPFQIT